MRSRRSFTVEFAEAAGRDLLNIVAYIAADNEAAAIRALERLETRAAALRTMPERGRIVPELATAGIRSYREIVVAPWRVIYRISDERVRVLAVVDSRRNLEDLLLERFVP